MPIGIYSAGSGILARNNKTGLKTPMEPIILLQNPISPRTIFFAIELYKTTKTFKPVLFVDLLFDKQGNVFGFG